MTFLEKFQLSGAEPQDQQLAGFLRTLIRRNEMPGKTKLPGLRNIAERTGVNYFQVQKATETLVQEGLLYKSHGHGCFVCERSPEEKTICVLNYFHADTVSDNSYAYLLYLTLVSEIRDAGYTPFLYSDIRPEAELARIPDDLAEMISAGRIAAMIVPQAPDAAFGWINKLQITHLTQLSVPCPDMMRPVKEALESNRFRNPLFLFPHNVKVPTAKDTVVKMMAKSGVDILPYRSRFLFTPGGENRGTFAEQAYHILKEELRKDPPDLLFVYPDIAIPGVIAAVYESGLRVPEDLTLILHCNRELPHFCPFPARYVESSVKKDAGIFLQMMNITQGDKKCVKK